MKTLAIVALLSCSAFAQVNTCSAPELLEHELLGVTPLEEWLQLSEAQVQGECGPGRACKSKSFTATSTTNAFIASGGGRFCLASATCNNYLQNNGGTSMILQTSGGYIDLNGAMRKTGGGGPAFLTYEDPDGFGSTGVAFASLTTCDAAHDGALQYDTTSFRWRVCRNGSAWLPLGNVTTLGDVVTAYHPGIAGLLNLPINQFDWPSQLFASGSASVFNPFSIRLDNAVTLVAGVGAGNAVYTVYNVTDAAATTATVTVPCAAAAGTVTTGNNDNSLTIFGSIKTFQLRLTTNGCGTLPVVQLTARWTGIPIGT